MNSNIIIICIQAIHLFCFILFYFENQALRPLGKVTKNKAPKATSGKEYPQGCQWSMDMKTKPKKGQAMASVALRKFIMRDRICDMMKQI